MTTPVVETQELQVKTGQARLDQFLAGQQSGMTRAQLQKLIVEGWVRLNG